MFERAEQWSQDLEDNYEQLDKWKREGDYLLYSMLPKSVADQLQNGQTTMNTCKASYSHCNIIIRADLTPRSACGPPRLFPRGCPAENGRSETYRAINSLPVPFGYSRETRLPVLIDRPLLRIPREHPRAEHSARAPAVDCNHKFNYPPPPPVRRVPTIPSVLIYRPSRTYNYFV